MEADREKEEESEVAGAALPELDVDWEEELSFLLPEEEPFSSISIRMESPFGRRDVATGVGTASDGTAPGARCGLGYTPEVSNVASSLSRIMRRMDTVDGALDSVSNDGMRFGFNDPREEQDRTSSCRPPCRSRKRPTAVDYFLKKEKETEV